MQASGQLVEFFVTGRNTRYIAARLVQYVDSVNSPGQNFLERQKSLAASGSPFGDVKDTTLSLVDEFRSASPVGGETATGNFIAGANQRPQNRALANYFPIGYDVG